jgi:biopolymer transport protein TolQ
MPSVNINVIELFLHAGIVVKLTLILMVCISIISWSIMISKYFYLARAYKQSMLFTKKFWECKVISEAFMLTKKYVASPVARVFRVGYLELISLNKTGENLDSQQKGDIANIKISAIGNIARSLRIAQDKEMTNMTRTVSFLATAGNTTPFIGLFGTVWGIMGSFHEIGRTGSATLAAVAPGISEALIATAVGLAVAIPAVMGYNYLLSKIKIIESELENFSSDFINIIEKDFLKSN